MKSCLACDVIEMAVECRRYLYKNKSFVDFKIFFGNLSPKTKFAHFEISTLNVEIQCKLSKYLLQLGFQVKKKNCFAKISHFLGNFSSFSHFVYSQKMLKFSFFFVKFCFNLFCEKMQKSHEKMQKFCEKMQKSREKMQKLLTSHNKTSSIKLSEKRIPQVLLSNQLLQL